MLLFRFPFSSVVVRAGLFLIFVVAYRCATTFVILFRQYLGSVVESGIAIWSYLLLADMYCGICVVVWWPRAFACEHLLLSCAFLLLSHLMGVRQLL